MKNEIVRILMSQVDPEPYPHIVVDDFFSLDTYMQMMVHFPLPDSMEPGYLDYTRQTDLIVDRGMVEADDGKFAMKDELGSERIDFWLNFTQQMFPNGRTGDLLGGVPEALCRKFGVDFHHSYACARLVIDEQGAGIGPHSDRSDKLISAIVYLGEDPGACGTMLLAPKNGFQPDVQERHYGYEKFDLVKVVEHKPNRLIAWPVDRPSFHAYHQMEPCFRKTLKFFVQKNIDPNTVRERIAATKDHAKDWRKTDATT